MPGSANTGRFETVYNNIYALDGGTYAVSCQRLQEVQNPNGRTMLIKGRGSQVELEGPFNDEESARAVFPEGRRDTLEVKDFDGTFGELRQRIGDIEISRS